MTSSPAPVTSTTPGAAALTIGGVFVDALARRDFEAIGRCVDPDVRFRALLPRRDVDTTGADGVVAEFRRWFGDSAEHYELLDATVGAVGPRLFMSWRIRMTADAGRGEARVAEQHAFADGVETLTALSLICSGFVPA